MKFRIFNDQNKRKIRRPSTFLDYEEKKTGKGGGDWGGGGVGREDNK